MLPWRSSVGRGVVHLRSGWLPEGTGILDLRGMAPQVIITDEIGHPNDGLALADAVRAGVQVIASCHGMTWESVKQHTWMELGGAAFKQAVLLSRRKGPGTIEQVLKLD